MSNLPVTFQQRVQERIESTIADLIPAEDLAAMVEAQVNHFRTKTLPEMINAEIRGQFSDAIKAEFKKPEYLGIWNQSGSTGASLAVKKIVEENAGAVLNSLIGGMVQMTIQQMQSNMPRVF